MGSRGRVTLQTIAREVGLSKYAVSRSLAGKSGVSEETRALIRETAQRLGYIKPAGQGTAGEVAVVFHDLDAVNSELYMQVQNGVQREAHRLGMSSTPLICCSSGVETVSAIVCGSAPG